jgi:hypothetical protein
LGKRTLFGHIILLIIEIRSEDLYMWWEKSCDLFSSGSDCLRLNEATAFSSAPYLHTIKCDIWTRDHLKLCFPWRQLTELELIRTKVRADVCLLILSKCSSLIRCTISFIGDILEDHASRIASLSKSPVYLPLLKHLELYLPTANIAPFLRCLTAMLPNFCELTLQNNYNETRKFLCPISPSDLRSLDPQSMRREHGVTNVDPKILAQCYARW